MSSVKVLGSGCKNCKALEARTAEAMRTLGMTGEIEKVTDYGEIASWGVMSTPALVVDDAVVLSGRVPTVDELAGILESR